MKDDEGVKMKDGSANRGEQYVLYVLNSIKW